MDDVKQMFRKIINGQSALKSELFVEIRKVDKKVGDLEIKIDKGFSNVGKKLVGLTKRVDKIGLQVARLEDDASTNEEFDKLEKRVVKVEQKVASI